MKAARLSALARRAAGRASSSSARKMPAAITARLIAPRQVGGRSSARDRLLRLRGAATSRSRLRLGAAARAPACPAVDRSRPGCRGACGGACAVWPWHRESSAMRRSRRSLDHLRARGRSRRSGHVVREALAAPPRARGRRARPRPVGRALGPASRRDLARSTIGRAGPRSGRGRWSRPGSDAERERDGDRAHARQPAARLAQLRRDRARDVDVARVELDVERGQRRARGDERRAGASGAGVARPEVGAQLAGAQPPAQLDQRRPRGRRRAPALRASSRARRRGTPARASSRAIRSRDRARLLAGRVAIALGVQLDDRADVERADRRDARRRGARMSICPTGRAAPASSALASGRGAPASVNTLRLWSASECESSSVAPAAKAASSSAIRPLSRPSETLGTASSGIG